jgi:hypothetical protein
VAVGSKLKGQKKLEKFKSVSLSCYYVLKHMKTKLIFYGPRWKKKFTRS